MLLNQMDDLQKRCTSEFLRLLSSFDIDGPENSADVIYGVRSDLCLCYFNKSWFRFSEQNGGEPGISRDWGLGRPVMESVPEVLRTFYQKLYATALNEDSSTPPPQHRYECSSPNLFRDHLMTLYRLGTSDGILVVNSTVVEAFADTGRQTPHDADLSVYADRNGIIRMCPNCRRTRNSKEAMRWDWVPFWVQNPPESVSHCFCDLCMASYYGKEYLDPPSRSSF
jgi:hypothetical protein